MLYTDFQNLPASEKIGLVKINCSEAAKGWSLYSGSIYSLSFNKVIDNITDSGVELTEAASLGTVVANSYYWDRQNGTLYLRTSDSVNPNSKFIVVESSLFFSNVSVAAPYDLGSGFEVNWLPLLKGTSDFGVALDNQNQLGFAIEGSGSIDLINDRAFWDSKFDKLTFENKRVSIYSWNRSLAITEAKIIYRGLVESKTWSSTSIQFKIKDSLNELRSAVILDDMQDYVGAKLSSKDLLTKQRVVYGYIYGHRPTNIDQLVNEAYELTGTVSITNASATVTGSGSAFLAEISPDDELTFDDGETFYTVESVASNTSLTLSEVFEGDTASGLTFSIRPNKPKPYINREFLIAGHALREPVTTVTASPSLGYIEVASTLDMEAGDAITVGSELTSILRISGNRLFLSPYLVNLASIGATVTRRAVSSAWIGSRELVYSRDYTVNAAGALLTLNQDAEFNIAPIKKLLGTSVTFTNTSRAVTGVGTFFKNDLVPGDWIRAYGQADFFQVLSIESDTALTLRSAATYSATTTAQYKSPAYYKEGTSVLSVDCLGKTSDGLTTGALIKTGPEIVKDLILNVGVDATDIDSASFVTASGLAKYKLGLAIPEKVSDKNSPKVRDVINKINQSIFGSLIQTADFKLKYNILSPKRDSTATTFTEKDVLSFKIKSDSSRIVKTMKLNYLKREYDNSADQANFLQHVVTNNIGTYLVATNKEVTQESYITDASDALIVARRYSFLYQLASSIIGIDTKLKAARLEVNDKVILEHENLYERIGSSSKRKFAAIQSIKKSVFDSSIEIEDLANAFTRCGVITGNTHPTYDLSSDLERSYAGYITDDFGMIDNNADTYGLHLIW